MTRILVVGINFAPEEIGTGKYTGEMAHWLAARGHTVRVVTAPPYYPAWKVSNGFSGARFRREQHGQLEVLRCPLYVPRRPTGLTRLLHLGSFAVTSALALIASLRWRPDVVICIAPTLAAAPAAWLYARLTGACCWLHVQDFELDAAVDMGVVRVGPLARVARAVERVLLRRFDRVSTISDPMLARLGVKGVSAGRRLLFRNWADTGAIVPRDGPSPYRRELGIPDDAVVALYSGNMGLKQGLELLAAAARALTDVPQLWFVFGGDGPAREALARDCDGLRRVRFLPLQPTERLGDWLGLADIHLLPQRADVADLVMPSKLTGMLASGRPVLATAAPGTGLALALQASGVCVSPGDAAGFTAALNRLAVNAARRRRLGEAARRQAVKELARDSVLHAFERQLLDLTGAPGAPHACTHDIPRAADTDRSASPIWKEPA